MMTAHGVFNDDVEMVVKVRGTPGPRRWLLSLNYRHNGVKVRRSRGGAMLLWHSSTHVN